MAMRSFGGRDGCIELIEHPIQLRKAGLFAHRLFGGGHEDTGVGGDLRQGFVLCAKLPALQRDAQLAPGGHGQEDGDGDGD